MAQVRGLCADAVCDINVQCNASLSCDSRKMKHTVCGTSKCHINGQRIDKCLLGHDISWTDVLFNHLHNLHTSVLCKLDTLRINCRDGSVALKTHTKSLSQTVHGVCGVHTGAGTASWTCLALVLIHILLGHLTCCISTNCLKHRRKARSLSLYVTGKHRATADKYGRDVDSGCCHQKTWYVLITVWNHNKTIKLMCHCHTLGRIGDQISCYKRILHADMTHGDTITDGDSWEYNRHTSCHCDA